MRTFTFRVGELAPEICYEAIIARLTKKITGQSAAPAPATPAPDLFHTPLPFACGSEGELRRVLIAVVCCYEVSAVEVDHMCPR